MDLRNGQIKVGQVLDDPSARAALERRFSKELRGPLVGLARGMTVEQLIAAVRPHVSEQIIQETLEELKRL